MSFDRITTLKDFADVMNISFTFETSSVYLARAVSSVPQEEKARLEEIFSSVINAVELAGLEPLLPVELGNVAKDQINPKNHELLFQAKIVLPLTYALSDGRGWEMGFSYGKKLLVPLVLPGQKLNIPSLRLPFQIPVVYDDPERLTGLLKELQTFESISFGEFDGALTVIGRKDGQEHDLRAISSKFMQVLPYDDF